MGLDLSRLTQSCPSVLPVETALPASVGGPHFQTQPGLGMPTISSILEKPPYPSHRLPGQMLRPIESTGSAKKAEDWPRLPEVGRGH